MTPCASCQRPFADVAAVCPFCGARRAGRELIVDPKKKALPVPTAPLILDPIGGQEEMSGLLPYGPSLPWLLVDGALTLLGLPALLVFRVAQTVTTRRHARGLTGAVLLVTQLVFSYGLGLDFLQSTLAIGGVALVALLREGLRAMRK